MHAPACQRYYASRLAAESPHPSTFDLPRGIFRPSTTGTKMLVKRAWTYEDFAADPDTFELVRHPSREPFTLPVWVQHALRTILAAQGPAARLAKARPLCADPHGATVCQSFRRPACGLARAGGMEVWHYHAQRSAVPPHATQLVEGSRLLVPQLGSPARWSANRVPRDRASEASGGAALPALPPPVPAAGPFVGGPARPAALPPQCMPKAEIAACPGPTAETPSTPERGRRYARPPLSCTRAGHRRRTGHRRCTPRRVTAAARVVRRPALQE